MSEIAKLLPGFNCGECGMKSCRDFAATLVDVSGLDRCTILKQNRFRGRAEEIAKLLAVSEKREEIVGVLDGLHAEFTLAPLPGAHHDVVDIEQGPGGKGGKTGKAVN